MVFRLPEYDPAAPGQRLHVVLRLPADLVADLSKRLQELFSGVTLEIYAEQELLLAVMPAGVDCQRVLIDLAVALDKFADSTGRKEVELLETRFAVRGERANGPARSFSRLLSLLDADDVPPAKGLSLRLEYGTSFGSGQHPSTRLAMLALEQLLEDVKPFPARMLDVGSGSGILALAGGLFGARRVLGVDIDPEALALAGENARRNGLADRVSFTGRPLRELEGPYDLVVANLSGAVMGGMLDDFRRLLAGRGWLVVSGLLGRQLEEISGGLAERGFSVRQRYREGNWRGALLAAAVLRP